MIEKNTRRAWTAYKSVPLPDCKVGDLVIEHGGIFRLENRRDWDDGETVTFDGHYVGPATDDREPSIPAHWRQNCERTDHRGGDKHGYWQVQGNHFRKATRITDDRPMYYHGETAAWDWRHEPAI